MNKLPIELHFEIQKFLKNKYEVLTICSLSSDTFSFENVQYQTSELYCCTSLKL
jgi:hypothetical protein